MTPTLWLCIMRDVSLEVWASDVKRNCIYYIYIIFCNPLAEAVTLWYTGSPFELYKMTARATIINDFNDAFRDQKSHCRPMDAKVSSAIKKSSNVLLDLPTIWNRYPHDRRNNAWYEQCTYVYTYTSHDMKLCYGTLNDIAQPSITLPVT